VTQPKNNTGINTRYLGFHRLQV